MLSKCQIIGPKRGALTSTPRRRRNEVNTESIPPAQASQQDGNAKPYNAELSLAGNGSNKPSGRFVPPQPNNTGSSSQEMDNSNTTVYYEKSTGECQNKSTSIQTSPKHPELRGTTTTTQTTNKKASQAGETQTMCPPSPKKPTSTGGIQTSPPKGNPHRQVDQGQPDCNQDREGQPANIISS